MAKKVRFSPIIYEHIPSLEKDDLGKGPIEITSLVTHIAVHVGVLEGSHITYLPTMEEYQACFGLERFVQGHLMRKGSSHGTMHVGSFESLYIILRLEACTCLSQIYFCYYLLGAVHTDPENFLSIGSEIKVLRKCP